MKEVIYFELGNLKDQCDHKEHPLNHPICISQKKKRRIIKMTTTSKFFKELEELENNGTINFDFFPFFINKAKYDRFVETIKNKAQNGNLPIWVEHLCPDTISPDDIKLYLRRFRQDTGLNVEFHFSLREDNDGLECWMCFDE